MLLWLISQEGSIMSHPVFFPLATAQTKNNKSNKQNTFLTSLSCCSVSSHVDCTHQHLKPQHGWICAADATVQLQELRLFSLFCLQIQRSSCKPASSSLSSPCFGFYNPHSTSSSLAYIPVLSPKTPPRTIIIGSPWNLRIGVWLHNTLHTHV